MIHCSTEDDPPPPPPDHEANIYRNCCGAGDVEFDFSPGKVFLANMFTPILTASMTSSMYNQIQVLSPYLNS